MNPTNKPTSRATELWKRFVGLFGGEAVSRKFGDSPPAEWIATIDRFRDFELERGMRRLVYSGKGHVPSLPEFVKLCRWIGHDEFDEPSTAVALPAPPAGNFDRWDIQANQHLLGYITREVSANPLRYGRPASVLAMRNADHKTSPNADASPEFIRAVGILVIYKNAWARDMREGNLDPETGEINPPSLESQKAAWADCIERAEAAIAQRAAA